MRRRAGFRFILPASFVWLAVVTPALTGSAARGASLAPTLSVTASLRAMSVSAPEPGPTDGRLLYTFQEGKPVEHFGKAVASTGDIDGDGRVDLVIGAEGVVGPGDGTNIGSAYVYFGGPFGNNLPDLIVHGGTSGDGFGSSVSSAGDVTGDGNADLIIGARRAGLLSRGRVFLYFGGPSLDEFSDFAINAPSSAGNFGASVTGLDINGDGLSDVIVGAPGFDGPTNNVGHVYVFLRLQGTPSVTLSGSAPVDHFGGAVGSAGDFNGDGYPDLAVGAPLHGGTGRVWLYYGGPGFDATPDLVLNGEGSGDQFGTAVASVGDVNGDGHDDLLVSAPFNDAAGPDAGRAYLYFGGPGADAVPDLVLSGFQSHENLGQSVASAGDMNTDGNLDFILGAPSPGVGDLPGGEGRAYVYFGGPPLDATPDLILNGEHPGDQFGAAVASVGDFSFDGGEDVLVGAYANDFGAADAGRAYLYTTWSHPPFVRAPASVVAGTRQFMEIGVSAVDAEGDPIQSLTAAPIPPGAEFAFVPNNPTGFLRWTPTDEQIGFYDVTFTAVSTESGSATTRIQVVFHNTPPALNPFDPMVVLEASTSDQTIFGFDDDGDPLRFQLIGAPSFASVVSIGPSTATVHLAPGYGDAGSYVAAIQIEDGHGGTASAPIAFTVQHQNRGPVLVAPGSVTGQEGSSIAVLVQANDPDGDAVTLGVLNQPPGSTFTDNGDATAVFSWTPGYEQAGTYGVTFTARDALGASGAPWQLAIVVENSNRGPAASPGGPYSGVINVPIAFDASGSSDPDGTALTYVWDFGDLVSGTGVTLSHTYTSGGVFAVTLTVSDGDLAAQAVTSASIRDIFPARAFTVQPNRTLRLASSRATWCAEVEPVENSFQLTDVLSSAVVLKYGAGQIAASLDHSSSGADRDANGIAELTACFSKADLRTLFAGLPKGTSTANVTLEGRLSSGGKFQALLALEVTSSGNTLSASIAPNPLNPSAVLTFSISRPGPVRIAIFDLRGRLVRIVLPAQELGAGYHDVLVDGRDEGGRPLSSGTYFYRIEAAEGATSGRFVLLK